jgi:hypothetical protein
VKGGEIMNLLHLSPATSRAAARENTTLDTTLYELIAAIIDTIERGEDALIDATVQELVASSKLRWLRSGKHLSATRQTTFVPFLNRN